MRLSFNFKASSLIETVIAISIITVCSLIATLFYSRVTNMVPPVKKYVFYYEIEKLLEETIINKHFDPVIKDEEEWKIERKVDIVNNDSSLIKVSFIITERNNAYIYNIFVTDTNEKF